MPWLQPFVKAGARFLLPCSHVLGAADLDKQGGQGVRLAALGGPGQRGWGGGRRGWGGGREVSVAAVMEQCGRG